ncbi:hypothetical protein LZK73_14025 [Neorhizobium galegae]|nr:hypothetical protein LZK73_14025 [Neorhizobium galegae]
MTIEKNMLRAAQHGHEAGRLLEQHAQIFPLLAESGILPLDRIGPAHQIRMHPEGAVARGPAAQQVKLGHVHRMLQNEDQPPRLVLDRCMGCAPVTILELSIGTWDRIGDERQMIHLSGGKDPGEGLAQQPARDRIRFAWKRVEHGAADKLFTAAPRHRQISVVHSDKPQFPVEYDIGIG